MDIRRRMLFKKKASSSGGGGSTTGGSYVVNLNNEWEATTVVPNPDSTLYDGVYRSASSYNVNNGVSIMYITITDCSSFKMYIRSYAESTWDYMMVSQLDQTINGNTSYSNTTLVKAHTRGNQQSGTLLSNYTLVEFTGITSGEHTITVVYRKDISTHSGDDRGYVLIEKMQAGSGDSGGDDEGPAVINNYLTIEALEDGLTASLSVNACEYCVDGDGNWKSLTAGTTTESINSGHTLSFRGNLTPAESKGIGTFTIDKKCNLKGNCMSMLFGDNAANNFSLSGKIYAFYKLFYNCINIVNVSNNFLPATTLVNYCYREMFRGCTSLKTAPDLPATTLGMYGCYYYMFAGCTSLTTSPELPATTLAESCYYYMFDGCTSLTTAPELPATTLVRNCYYAMFQNCTSLTTVPRILPATTLAGSCYTNMFCGCTSLIITPELPATKLAEYCYYGIFFGCSSLVTAPELPATTLANNCYYLMFQNCTSLTTAPRILPATTLVGSCYYGMFQNCTSLTTAPELPATTLASKCYYNMFYGCTSLTTAPRILPATTLVEKCYFNMFYNCTSLTTAPELPATTLASDCYYYMFSDCTSLVNAPELPATTLAQSCYSHMFSDCTSLTTAPELPAMTLAYSCYYFMFSGCTKLTTAPELPATTLAEHCYTDMFRGCTSLTTAPDLPAITLAPSCYYAMFQNCTSLITAPELPVTTLVEKCYAHMFYGCKKLNYIKMLATDISATDCLYLWVNTVASTGTFVKNTSMTSLPTGWSGIPSGWTVVNDGEESGGNLITFTIDGTEYQAEQGMTWGEWVNSEYNVINASIHQQSNGLGYISLGIEQGSSNVIHDSSFSPVLITNEIIANHSYNVIVLGGGV